MLLSAAHMPLFYRRDAEAQRIFEDAKLEGRGGKAQASLFLFHLRFPTAFRLLCVSASLR
jgi:hypothetical protein